MKIIKIEAAKGWVNTGYKPGAEKGLYVNIFTSGNWCCRKDDRPYGTRSASGGRENIGTARGGSLVHVESNKAYPYYGKGAWMGQLIGKLREDGESFVIGKMKSLSIAAIDPDLTLYLGINFPDLSSCDGEIKAMFTVSDRILERPPLAYSSRKVRRRHRLTA